VSDLDEPRPLDTGAVSVHEIATPTRLGDVAAILWVPDPEARRGWREFYVNRAPQPTAPRPGTLGFRT
jgi:hypothetical protein